MTTKSSRRLYRPTEQEEQQHGDAPALKADEGLVGFFGYTFTTRNGERQLQYQFRVVRALPPDRWVVQFYSFMDGCPNKLGVYNESYLLSDDVALYPVVESWHEGYNEYGARCRVS